MTSQVADIDLQKSVREIYDLLTRLQFPSIIQIDDSDGDECNNLTFQKINQRIGKYLHGSQSRLQLLEWLILKFDYTLLPRQKCTKQERVQKLRVAFSQLGLLPVSKYSKNLDYEKYVQGLLSYQSSVNSVLKLCLFVKQSVQNRKRQKPDTKFCSFLKDLIQNKALLVNVKYDPFPLTLPPQFSDLSQPEFDALYRERSKRFFKNFGPEILCIENEESFMESSQQLKLRYKTTLQQLSHTINKHSTTKITTQKEEIEASRLLKVDGEFINSIRSFNKMTSVVPEEKINFSSSIEKIKQSLQQL